MSDRKAVIKNADMSEEMQQDAVDSATQAMEKFNIEKVSVCACVCGRIGIELHVSLSMFPRMSGGVFSHTVHGPVNLAAFEWALPKPTNESTFECL